MDDLEVRRGTRATLGGSVSFTSRFDYNLDYNSGAWTVMDRTGAGRCLIAAREIRAGTKIFTERPIAVAYPEGEQDLITAVACKLVDMSYYRLVDDRFQPAGDFAAVCELQCTEGTRPGTEDWAQSVAKINVHGAGGTLIDPAHQRRGVLGLLSSMMQHECAPSCVIHISEAEQAEDDEEGSLMSLYTIRKVAIGEALSISYIGAYQPSKQRGERLLAQHGFVCACPRCSKMPELVRAFVCPACGEGPSSPISPLSTCRTLHCGACDRTSVLGEVDWERVEEAERCDECSQQHESSDKSCERCMAVLHPQHHRPALTAQRNLGELSPAARVEALRCHLYARERLYSSFVDAGDTHPLVAVDIENVAVAQLAAGDVAAAAESFANSAARFEAFYGASSEDAARCRRGTSVTSLAEFKQVCGLMSMTTEKRAQYGNNSWLRLGHKRKP